MRKARFEFKGRVHEGTAEGEELVSADKTYSIEEVDLLPPCQPSKVVAVGRNYADHADEMGSDLPEFPLLFFKPPSSVIGPYDRIAYPDSSENLHYEGELGVVIGEKCRSVPEDEAFEYIEGITCVNDVTARDWQEKESQWARAKGADTFCPIGPFVQTEVNDLNDLEIETRVNGETKQSSNTGNMVFSVEELISETSRFITLNPGDVIATGTPSGVGPLETGDVVGIEVESVGVLLNEVVSAD